MSSPRLRGSEKPLNHLRARDRALQFLPMKEGIPSKHECLAQVDHVPALCTHRPPPLPGMLGEAVVPLGCWQWAVGGGLLA